MNNIKYVIETVLLLLFFLITINIIIPWLVRFLVPKRLFDENIWLFKERSFESSFYRKIKEKSIGLLFLVLVVGIGQKCNLTSSLNGFGQFSLMLCTSAGNASGKNFTTLGNVFTQGGDIFVINCFHFINAKRTNFSSGLSGSEASLFFHESLPPFKFRRGGHRLQLLRIQCHYRLQQGGL